MRKERELFRHHFVEPVHLDLRALWVDDEILPGFNLHSFRLLNISGSGMQVETDLELPPAQKIHVQFAFKLDGEHLLKGQVIRRGKINDNVYTFAVKFNISVGDQIKLIRAINLLQLKKNQFKKES